MRSRCARPNVESAWFAKVAIPHHRRALGGEGVRICELKVVGRLSGRDCDGWRRAIKLLSHDRGKGARIERSLGRKDDVAVGGDSPERRAAGVEELRARRS